MIFYEGETLGRVHYKLDFITEPDLKLRVLHNISDEIVNEKKNEIIFHDESGYEYIDFEIRFYGNSAFLSINPNCYDRYGKMACVLNVYMPLPTFKTQVIEFGECVQSEDISSLSPEMIKKICDSIKNDTNFLLFINQVLADIGRGINNYICESEIREIRRFSEECKRKLIENSNKHDKFAVLMLSALGIFVVSVWFLFLYISV